MYLKNFCFAIYEWDSNDSRDRRSADILSARLKKLGHDIINLPFSSGILPAVINNIHAVFLINIHGSLTAVNLAKKFKSIGIPVFGMYGEGNFRSTAITEMVWGHNSKRERLAEKYFIWSSESKSLIDAHFPEQSSWFESIGSLTTEYIILKKLENSSANPNNFRVGVGCWDFGILDGDDTRHKAFVEQISIDELSAIKTDELLFSNDIKKLAANMPNLEFRFRPHPLAQINPRSHGFMESEGIENFREFNRGMSLAECIDSCHVWITYESTTSFEAFLYGKSILMYVPSGLYSDSSWRSEAWKIQPVLTNYQELYFAIDNLANNINISADHEFSGSDVMQKVYGDNIINPSQYISKYAIAYVESIPSKASVSMKGIDFSDCLRLAVHFLRRVPFLNLIFKSFFKMRSWNIKIINNSIDSYGRLMELARDK